MSALRASGALAAFTAIVLVVSCSSLSSAPEAPPPKVIVGGTLIDGTPRPPQPNTVLLIAGGKIVAVGSAGSVTIPDNAVKTNATGLFVTPGRGGLALIAGADADIFLLAGSPLENPTLLASPARTMKAGEWTDAPAN